MKIEIEISEEDAACIWANALGEQNPRPVAELITWLAENEANRYRGAFPKAVQRAVEQFRLTNNDAALTPEQEPTKP